jgi:hypothetical protein
MESNKVKAKYSTQMEDIIKVNGKIIKYSDLVDYSIHPIN